MINAKFVGGLKPGAILINTSRGSVAEDGALIRGAESGHLGGLILDVFENEPAINPELVERTALATAHISGYSYDGKVNGTAMIYRAACEFFGRPAEWDPAAAMARPLYPCLTATAADNDEDVLRDLVLTVYDIEADDQRLRAIVGLPPAERGPHFDRLRKTYPIRREFPNTTVDTATIDDRTRAKIAGLGFRT
jgi:erythronate-4-phosphate dehydrogenase